MVGDQFHEALSLVALLDARAFSDRFESELDSQINRLLIQDAGW